MEYNSGSQQAGNSSSRPDMCVVEASNRSIQVARKKSYRNSGIRLHAATKKRIVGEFFTHPSCFNAKLVSLLPKSKLDLLFTSKIQLRKLQQFARDILLRVLPMRYGFALYLPLILFHARKLGLNFKWYSPVILDIYFTKFTAICIHYFIAIIKVGYPTHAGYMVLVF